MRCGQSIWPTPLCLPVQAVPKAGSKDDPRGADHSWVLHLGWPFASKGRNSFTNWTAWSWPYFPALVSAGAHEIFEQDQHRCLLGMLAIGNRWLSYHSCPTPPRHYTWYCNHSRFYWGVNQWQQSVPGYRPKQGGTRQCGAYFCVGVTSHRLHSAFWWDPLLSPESRFEKSAWAYINQVFTSQ